ncbi:elongation factor Ts, partial [bacterium AH-315-A23]|nr:elongation factor Ts [bacterium AH-315-A23]
IELGRLGKTLKNVPTFISRAQLTDKVIEQTKVKLQEELKAEGKPEAIWDRILPGKLERFISDNTTLDQEQCLLDQNFIKNEKQNVAEYVKTIGDVSVTDFKRVSLA